MPGACFRSPPEEFTIRGLLRARGHSDDWLAKMKIEEEKCLELVSMTVQGPESISRPFALRTILRQVHSQAQTCFRQAQVTSHHHYPRFQVESRPSAANHEIFQQKNCSVMIPKPRPVLPVSHEQLDEALNGYYPGKVMDYGWFSSPSALSCEYTGEV